MSLRLPPLLFITGTDTGVGKTFLTCLLLRHLRQSGVKALAIKPFCTGDLQDARRLSACQDHALSLAEITPFYFPQPVAPLVAARRARRTVHLRQVVAHVQALRKRADCLLVEGCGGLLVPLGEAFTVADLILNLGCPTALVARNRLGTVNHTLLSLRCLGSLRAECPVVVLMDAENGDPSAVTNAKIIAQFGAPVRVVGLPFLSGTTLGEGPNPKCPKKIQKPLAEILRSCSLTPLSAHKEGRENTPDQRREKRRK